MNAVLVLRSVPQWCAALPGLTFGVTLAVTLQGRQKGDISSKKRWS
jgi:hypothetical protein